MFETPKEGFILGIEDDDDHEDSVIEEEDVGSGASHPYMGRGRRFLDKQYDFSKFGEQLMVVDSLVFIDIDDNFTIK